MLKKFILVVLVGLLALTYQAIQPPHPREHTNTGPRIKLRDGRYLAYKEYGVPKELAKYKVIFVHSFGCSKHEGDIIATGVMEEMGLYMVSFDRPGYGESDPHPKRTQKSFALDIRELADQLELGTKFYVMGYSLGGQLVWSCLKYIPDRLAGVALLGPVINHWWPGFPSNLSSQVYRQHLTQDQWTYRVAHYAPWLVYWWNTQKWFPSSSVIHGGDVWSPKDLEVLSKLSETHFKDEEAYSLQQGEFESLHRDAIFAFAKWEFDPMDLRNPFPSSEGSVHLWQGSEDGLVLVMLQRYIAEKLPWISYHELSDAGHLFPYDNDIQIVIFQNLFGLANQSAN